MGELAQGGDGSNRLPLTADLVGRDTTLHFENGWIIKYRIKTIRRLSWNKISPSRKSRWTSETYSAMKVREGIYFLDHVRHLERATTISFVLDLNGGIFTAVIGQLPTRAETEGGLLSRALAGKELTGVKAIFFGGSIDKPFSGTSTPRHRKTNDLIGKRVEYTYSPTDLYEHVYLDENFYTWHCLKGAERGLADTDRCDYFGIADKLYLFVWREKIIPTLGVLIEDFNQMRTSGKLFGYHSNDFGKLSNFMVGAKARMLDAKP